MRSGFDGTDVGSYRSKAPMSGDESRVFEPVALHVTEPRATGDEQDWPVTPPTLHVLAVEPAFTSGELTAGVKSPPLAFENCGST